MAQYLSTALDPAALDPAALDPAALEPSALEPVLSPCRRLRAAAFVRHHHGAFPAPGEEPEAADNLLATALAVSGRHWVWTAGAGLCFSFLSETFSAASGCSAREFIGLSLQALIPHVPDPAMQAVWRAALAERKPFRDMEFRLLDCQGHKRVLSLSGVPQFSETRECVGWQGLGSDVTVEAEQRQYLALLERAKVESDRRVKAIFDGAETFTLLLLIDGTVVEINQAALAFRNLRREEVTGQSLWDGRWFGDQDQARQIIQAVVEQAALGAPTSLDLEIADARGERRILAISCRPIFSPARQVHYILVEAHDMTAFVQMQQRNRELEMEVIQGQKLEALGTLAGGIAHEINTPIQYIGDNLSFVHESFQEIAHRLERGTTPLDNDASYLVTEIPVAITEAQEGVSRVSQIVRAIKEFSYPDAGHKTWADLAKALETTATVSRNQWKYVADLTFAIEPDVPPVYCELGEINQVILNLIINAAHAIEERKNLAGKGAITLSLRQENDTVILGVADTGAGIAPEHRDKIFNMFYTTKAPGRGTGQGLAICQNIVVRKHGGRIRFETVQGQGTIFYVVLPIKAPEHVGPEDVGPLSGQPVRF